MLHTHQGKTKIQYICHLNEVSLLRNGIMTLISLDKGIEYFSDPFIVLTGPNQSYTATSYCYYKIAVGSNIGYCGGEVYVNGVKVAEHPYNSSGMTYRNGYLNAGDTISTRNDSSPYRVELYHR